MSIQNLHYETDVLSVAQELASQFAVGAAQRDSQRQLPLAEIDQFSNSGLWAITVPRQYGGIEVSNLTLVKVIATIAQADSSLAQIPQSHFVLLDGLRLIGSDYQKAFFYKEVLEGKRIGNAFSETGGKDVFDIHARLQETGNGLFLTGRKAYATGALYADWIPVSALDDQGNLVYAYLKKGTPGLTVIDDWDGLGQRTTASGTVLVERVEVNPDFVIHRHLAFKTPSLAGPFSQLLHAAIDLGIAQRGFHEAIRIVRSVARPWVDSGLQRASDDVHSIAIIGDLQVRLRAATAVTEQAAQFLDEHWSNPDANDVANASVRVAEARILTDDIALLVSNKLFELGGTRTALASSNYDRHWRDARTHTLHDPVRWKRHLIGNFTLNEVPPPLHVWA